MKVKIIAVGNLKDKFNKLGEEEYAKRIKRFANFEIVEIKEQNNCSIGETLKREGEDIKKHLEGAVVVLDIDGKNISSTELAEKMNSLTMTQSTISFVIGGSNGVLDEIKQNANFRLSFSKMTFPHGLFRVMLLEQIYRSFAIRGNLPYHK